MNEREHVFPTVRGAFLIVLMTLCFIFIADIVWSGSSNKGKMLLLESLTLAPVLGYVWVRKLSFREVFRWHGVKPSVLLVSGGIGLGLTVITDELSRIVQWLLPMPEEIQQTMEAFLRFNSAGELLLVFLTVVIVAGFAEEMLFRGFFQGTLERVMDVTRAVLATAFVFAFVHFNPWWLVEVLILGVLLGVLTWRSGSIFPSVIVHMVKNGLAVVFMNTDASRLGWFLMKDHVSPVWVAAGLGIVVFGFRMFYRMTIPTEQGF
ncbi:MAG: type II CAAX endopeptidase family protein [bacterium]